MTKYEEDTKAMQEYAKIKVKCKYCCHTNTMPVFMNTRICNYCKKLIQNNTKVYFKYKMRKLIG